MPNRREPLTKDMVTFLIKKSAALNLPDGKYAVMTDWFILALQAGFRRMEWSQDATKLATTKSFQCNIDGSPSAFIQSDFEFRGPNGRRLVHSPSLHIDDIETVNITWRFQKNLDNGQTIPFAKDVLCPNLCCVSAALRIWRRAERLVLSSVAPMAVFVHTKQATPQYITDIHITQLLQEAATGAHNITCKKDLARFTAHSLRVGACVLLHSQGSTAELIKLRLRWKSDAFMCYLRNIDAIAEIHRDVIRNA